MRYRVNAVMLMRNTSVVRTRAKRFLEPRQILNPIKILEMNKIAINMEASARRTLYDVGNF